MWFLYRIKRPVFLDVTEIVINGNKKSIDIRWLINGETCTNTIGVTGTHGFGYLLSLWTPMLFDATINSSLFAQIYNNFQFGTLPFSILNWNQLKLNKRSPPTFIHLFRFWQLQYHCFLIWQMGWRGATYTRACTHAQCCYGFEMEESKMLSDRNWNVFVVALRMHYACTTTIIP